MHALEFKPGLSGHSYSEVVAAIHPLDSVKARGTGIALCIAGAAQIH